MISHKNGRNVVQEVFYYFKLVISKTLSDLGEMLPQDLFHRIHHGTLVNLSHVTRLYKSDGGYIVLDNGEKLAVSKSKKDSLMERLRLK